MPDVSSMPRQPYTLTDCWTAGIDVPGYHATLVLTKRTARVHDFTTVLTVRSDWPAAVQSTASSRKQSTLPVIEPTVVLSFVNALRRTDRGSI